MNATAETEVVESTAVEVHQPQQPGAIVLPTVPSLEVAPTVQAEDLVKRLTVIKQAMDTAMERDVDYGVIPGTKNPTLLKPGAEKLAVLFQFDCQTTHSERWGPGDHLTVVARTVVFHAPTGARLGSGEGLCSTRESKYAHRFAGLKCPECSQETVRKSRPRPDGSGGDGWYCWANPNRGSNGCGATFPDGDTRITGQKPGKVDNPDLPDSWNTAIKMARKRALVDAVLVTTSASAIFTQDAEDLPDDQVAAQAAQQPRNGGNGHAGNGQRPAPTATTKPNDRPASANQRRLLNNRAAEADLPPSDFANIILKAQGDEPRDYDSQEAASGHLSKLIERLPMRLVDAVLDGIKAASS